MLHHISSGNYNITVYIQYQSTKLGSIFPNHFSIETSHIPLVYIPYIVLV